MDNEIIIPELNSETIESMIYEIRGVKVMLDFELAKVYGYTTKAFNQQVKNNIEKFPKRYRFQLTKDELQSVKSKILTSPNNYFVGQNGGTRKLPYAFTEQGIYMLMTVLKGELATKQSIILIDTFKQMKDYIVESNNLVSKGELYDLINNVKSNTNDIKSIKKEVKKIKSNILLDDINHYLILDDERIEADMAYQKIYKLAKKSLYIIDDYIDIKTLQLLKVCANIEIILFSDNKAKNNINNNYISDFMKDTKINIKFKENNNKFHDRYIIVDFDTKNEMIYHCGASSKDSGNKINTIVKINENGVYKPLIEDILENRELLFNS